MENKVILKEKKLIAKFMGWYIVPYCPSGDVWNNETDNRILNLCDFSYHSDWNWLMSVVDKIESIIPDNNNVRRFLVSIKMESCVILDMYDTQKDFLNLYYKEHATKKEAVYFAVVEFIKWYNKQTEFKTL
jgi:hypothetical protein